MAQPLPPLALAYHGVAAVPLRDDPHRLFTRPAALRRHVRRLRSWGYQLVTVGELSRMAENGSAAGHAALSFDDGFADQLGSMLPAMGVVATVFPVTGWLGGRHPHAPYAQMLTVAELRSLHAAGMEIGGHTVTHPDLTALAFDQARDELEQCRRELETLIDAAVEVAAYPWGAATPETQAACAAAGFRAAVRTLGAGAWNEPYALPREEMLNASSTLGLRLKRDGRYREFSSRLGPRTARRILLGMRGRRRPG